MGEPTSFTTLDPFFVDIALARILIRERDPGALYRARSSAPLSMGAPPSPSNYIPMFSCRRERGGSDPSVRRGRNRAADVNATRDESAPIADSIASVICSSLIEFTFGRA